MPFVFCIGMNSVKQSHHVNKCIGCNPSYIPPGFDCSKLQLILCIEYSRYYLSNSRVGFCVDINCLCLSGIKSILGGSFTKKNR